MAATAQAQRSTSAAKSSTKVTPITHAASVAVCRNLLRASVGQICYQRGVFDEDAFDVVKMAGTTVRCLQRAPEGKAGAAPELVQVHQLARCLEEGVAEAMQLGYLRAVVLAFQAGHPAESKPGHPAPLLEAYTLKVSYSDSHEVSIVLQELEGLPQHAGPEAIFNNKAASVSLAAGIKAQASTMMRSVITMCHTLRPLPDDTIVTLKLYYYDERVPDDWQPPHFQDVTGQDDVLFESQAGLIKTPIGKTSTLHHRLSLKSTHLQSMELPGESENVDGVICDEDALPVTKGGGSASEKAAALASADVQDPALLARLQKAILARGSVSIKALGAQLDMASSAVQACLIQLEGIGFVKRRAGLGVRYQIADAGALVRPAHQPAQTSSGTANLDAIPAAQLDAMLLLDSLHVANTNFITARQVQSEHGISDKAVAQATLAWLEKQGCLERAKQANLGRKVLRDKHALSLLCTFRSALVSSGRRLASTRDTSAYTSEERTQHLLAQAQARHKAHVAAMYESAAAARQMPDETPHTGASVYPSSQSANRKRSYASTQQATQRTTDSAAPAGYAAPKLKATGGLPPAVEEGSQAVENVDFHVNHEREKVSAPLQIGGPPEQPSLPAPKRARRDGAHWPNSSLGDAPRASMVSLAVSNFHSRHRASQRRGSAQVQRRSTTARSGLLRRGDDFDFTG